MKNAIRILVISSFFLVVPLLMMGQNPPHPNGGSGPGSGNTPVGGGAPIGSGLVILMALGLGYRGRKIYNARKRAF